MYDNGVMNDASDIIGKNKKGRNKSLLANMPFYECHLNR